MNKYLLAFLVGFAKLSFALPAVAVPNLTYASNVESVGINNIDVRGALINSGKFSVVEAPKNFNLATINTSDPGKQYGGESSILPTQSALQDNMKYILIGQVISAETFNNYYDIPGTDKTSGTRTMAVTVSYKLLRLQDKVSIAAFNAYASSSQTVILKAGELIRVNQSALLHNLSKELGNNVVEQLMAQYKSTGAAHEDSSDVPLVSKVTTYD